MLRSVFRFADDDNAKLSNGDERSLPCEAGEEGDGGYSSGEGNEGTGGDVVGESEERDERADDEREKADGRVSNGEGQPSLTPEVRDDEGE